MLIDTHCHVDRFTDPDAIVSNCDEAKVFTVAVTHLPSHFQMAADALLNSRYVRPALGFHPLAIKADLDELQIFRTCFANAQFIGEVGLDYSAVGLKTKEIQLRVFREVVERLAHTPKITTIHTKKSASDVIAILIEHRVTDVILHWYSDSTAVLRHAVQAGFYFSINSAMLCAKSGQKVLELVPKSRILTETDGPYVKVGGKPVCPLGVAEIVESIGQYWGCNKVEAESIIETNFRTLCKKNSFELPD